MKRPQMHQSKKAIEEIIQTLSFGDYWSICLAIPHGLRNGEG